MRHSRERRFPTKIFLQFTGAALIACLPVLATAMQQPRAVEELEQLSRCSVSIYEAIRFIVVQTQGDQDVDLISLAGEFNVILNKFDRNFANFTQTQSNSLNSRRLASLKQAGDSLHEIAESLKTNDHEAMFRHLIAAKFSIQTLAETVNADDAASTRSGIAVESVQLADARRRLVDSQKIATQAVQDFWAAKVELTRADELAKKGLLSQAEYESARVRLDQSQLALQKAEADVESHRVAIRNLTEDQPGFNKLTHVMIDPDGKGFKFFGEYDPHGPKHSIPYSEILAEAVRVGEEKGAPQERESLPGFSLVPSAGFYETVAEFRAKVRNFDEMFEATQKFYEDNQGARELYLKSARQQALPEIRVALKEMLKSRMAQARINQRIDKITSDELLTETLRQLFREGILKEADGNELLWYINTAIGVYQNSAGTIFFYPEGTAEGVVRKCLFVEPRFYGLDSKTFFAKIVFNADVAIKELAGSHALAEQLPFHQTYIEWRFKNAPISELLESVPSKAIQIWPRSVQLSASADRRLIVFERAELEIKIRTEGSNDPPTKLDAAYASYLSSHYEDYARELDSLWEFRELIKILAAVRFLKSKGATFNLASPEAVWEPPNVVQSKWQVASVGTGDNFLVSTGFFGGVILQVQNQTLVKPLAETRARQLINEAGRAPGRPIAGLPQLLEMDRPDVISNLREMSAADLSQMSTQLAASNTRLAENVASMKKQELTLQMKTAAPPDYLSWKEGLIDVAEKLPGVGLAQQFGEDAARDLAGSGSTSFEKIEKAYQKGLDDIIDTKEPVDILLGDLDRKPTETRLTIVRETLQAYRAIKKSQNWTDARNDAAPHVGKILEQMPQVLAENLDAAKSNPAVAQTIGLKVKLFVMATKFTAELAYAGANVAIVNRALRKEREANGILLLNVHNTRTDFERKQRENGSLLELIKAEQNARATQR